MERPAGVTILAVLYFIGVAFAGLAGLLFILGGSMLSGLARSSGPGAGIFALGGAIVGMLCLGFALLYLLLGIGFIKLQNWARIVTIILTGLSVLLGLLGLFGSLLHLNVLVLVYQLIVVGIEVWIVVYLFKPQVKQAFGATGF